MGVVSRRGLILGVAASGGACLVGGQANATVARSMSLQALVKGSSRIVVVTPLQSDSHFEELGRRRRVVTDTRVRVEEALAKGPVQDSELMVRTLGGSVGRLGELVHGQARLALGETCVAFLLQGPDGLHYVSGMAQGHYPLTSEATRRLMQSPDLAKIVDFDSSAVKELVGVDLGAARTRIRALSER